MDVNEGQTPTPTGGEESGVSIPEELSLLPLRDTVLFPVVVVPLAVSRESSVKLIDDAAVSGSRVIGTVAMKSPEIEKPTLDDVYRIGTAAVIHTMLKLPEGVRLIVQGLRRIEILECLQTEPYLRVRVRVLPEDTPEAELPPDAQMEMEALRRSVGALFQKVVSLSPDLPDELQAIPQNVQEAHVLADLICAHIRMPIQEKQELLEIIDVRERLRRLASLLNRDLEILELQTKIQSQVHTELGKMQRDYYLREQLKQIQKELGETDERTAEIEELRAKIEAAEMPEEARKEADRELDRLSKMPPQAAEYTVARTYIDWLVTLPWNTSTEDNLDMREVREVLDADHYGIEKVKERILEYLAVRKFNPESHRHPILCFAGPPGVGKTSLGKSIARALGRKFFRMSLGGIRDEAEIRGHRRTYIGALPGQIIQGIRRAGSNNPLFMLDEIDKVGADFRGDPSSALLEVLDPEQNGTFRDHYLDVPFDLSRVLFITTANVLDTILPPLRDRMEIIELSGYTEQEKLQIARRHLVPKQMSEHGLTPEHIRWEDDGIRAIVLGYTREAGVRNLEREVAAVCRKVTREFAEGRTELAVIDSEAVRRYLGVPRFEYEEIAERTSQAGVATGLAWTPVGGDVMFIEATAMPGGRSLMLTGQLGDVMKESAQAALSFVRSHAAELGIDATFFRRNDIHVHVPAGAIPKDGPSAGVTMATAIASLATGRRVRSDVAMTGEITLTGRVLPVGGIKEKVLAAHRAGLKRVILPERNRKDMLEDVPEEVRQSIQIEYADTVRRVLDWVLEPEEAAPAAEETSPRQGQATPERIAAP
ncbi:MAG TPA: endopeptidase La [Armatimonadetes bacterium]|nr:endopeptidase La [Armatimonadota bacterium]